MTAAHDPVVTAAGLLDGHPSRLPASIRAPQRRAAGLTEDQVAPAFRAQPLADPEAGVWRRTATAGDGSASAASCINAWHEQR